MNNINHKFWELSTNEVLDQLKTKRNGLNVQEAQRRLEAHGSNSLTMEGRNSALKIFILQFKNPLVLILVFASILSGFLGEIISTLIIITIILVSAVLSFFQEYKAEKIIAKLRKKVSVKASVVRGKKIKSINAEDLVVGDIVLLEMGKVVPADLRIIFADDLLVNESILTGESMPVEKRSFRHIVKYYLPQSMQNLAFAGTHISQGSGRGVVIATGKNTEFGKTAKLLQIKPQQTQFQKGISDLGFFLFKIILLFSLVVFLFLAILRGNWIQSLLFSLAIAVGISPELLPVIITINLANGANKMSKKQVIVKRLMSIENLGNSDILCTDKTGTLTAGNISLNGYYGFGTNNSKKIFEMSLLCNTLIITKNVFGNPLDEAIFQYAKKNSMLKLADSYKIIDSLVFDFIRRRMSVIVEKKSKRMIICKGAIDEVISICTSIDIDGKIKQLNKSIQNKIKKTVLDLENEGLKVLLVAYKETEKKDKYETTEEKEMTLVGYLVFSDPVKKTVKSSLKCLDDLGVKVKLLTGDTEAVAKNLLKQINFEITKIISGEQLQKMTKERLVKEVKSANVFVKVTPQHKLEIINALKEKGHTVSFLGDGVNDAPALRAADVGISVDSATDIAKEASDIILLQKNLSVLVDGIKEGRKTFGNTLKYIFCTISSNYGNMVSVVGAAIFLPFIPMLPVQILLLNFLSDLPMLAISTDNVDEEYLKKPKRWDIKVINKFMVFFGLISSFFDFITFGFLIIVFGFVSPIFQAGWFWHSFIAEVILIFIIRTRKFFWQSKSSRTLVATSVITTILVLIILLSPARAYFGFALLSITALLVIVGINLVYFAAVEAGKKIFYKKYDI